MSDSIEKVETKDPWEDLKAFTDARIALGRCGVAPPLASTLDFRFAHAQARDAVHQIFEWERIAREIEPMKRTLVVASQAGDRFEYLTRPDKGRLLDADSRQRLSDCSQAEKGADLCIVVADGLSARAIHENAVPFLERFLKQLAGVSISVSPVCVARNARVALSDPIGAALRAKLVCMLVGERPGLSSPNSMGIYLTYDPLPGKTDEARNCISNVRQGGLSIERAAQKTSYLIENALRLKRSGVALKDEMPSNYLPFIDTPRLA
ncbi:ethanolamine ammonia-lyase subunit EutC [Pelagicoccus sp. SDUM812003]|uniref:ethanolamine ammonia-lyase subunit EutC n=1 Tax=Pelagicoccus sp. SDUM812003 TaxID=3041267 RepID=UPI00280FC4D5|nr:ethanolamine ammonia-lyase subunit EutC [Pelagicoccus sp. SDUM812003]MDQ8205160.1 ethanolamine ammonia-lyase subunit EutC [Pelagicoccus sp. SDUM812003]